MEKLNSVWLIILLGVVIQDVFAAGECDGLGLNNALLGLCVAYTTEGNDCLYDGSNDSVNCAVIRKNFFRISGGDDLDNLLNIGDADAIIGPEGGTIILQGVAAVHFPEDSFVEDTLVSISTSSADDVDEVFEEFASIFLPLERLGYEIRIITDSAPPLSEFLAIDIIVPDTFISSIPDNYRVEAFVIVEQGSDQEIPFPVFELIPSTYDSLTSTVSFDLPGAAFFNGELAQEQYQAIITLAPTPGIGATISNTLEGAEVSVLAAATSVGACQASSISCPVAGGCSVNSPYNPARKHPITGQTRPHNGVDYAAANGDSILSASDGVIERSYSSQSYGETIIVRHTNGSATLYAHLQSRGVVKGDSVAAGQQIGTADSTGLSSGPHLHFEYVPNGQIIQSKNRIDPDPCIDALASGSITVRDSGSLADDSFQLSLDGFVIGATAIGASNTIAINNIIAGQHLLELLVLVAPDNVGTYTVTLNDGITFSDGSTSKSGSPPQGTLVSWTINVPVPTTP